MTTMQRTTTEGPGRVPVDSLRRTASIVGWLFVITYITSIAAKVVFYPPLFEGDYIVGTDEDGDAITDETVDLTRPTILVLGNETRGMSQAWGNACHQVVRIPMVGSASSLNVANAGSILLYEAHRQRATR